MNSSLAKWKNVWMTTYNNARNVECYNLMKVFFGHFTGRMSLKTSITNKVCFAGMVRDTAIFSLQSKWAKENLFPYSPIYVRFPNWFPSQDISVLSNGMFLRISYSERRWASISDQTRFWHRAVFARNSRASQKWRSRLHVDTYKTPSVNFILEEKMHLMNSNWEHCVNSLRNLV